MFCIRRPQVGTKAVLAIIMYLFLCFRATAQEYSYAQYNVKDGLAGSVVYCAAEDKDGFLWFGTNAGLSRFDGTHFTNFTTTEGLPDNEVLRLFVDSRNRVWIMSFKDELCYYSKGKIYDKHNDPTLALLNVSEVVTSMAEDKTGNILVVTQRTATIITSDQNVKLITLSKKVRDDYLESGINDKGEFTILWNNWVEDEMKGLGICAFDKDHTNNQPYNVIVGVISTRHNCTISPFALIYPLHDTIRCVIPGKNDTVLWKAPPNLQNISVLNDSICSLSMTNGVAFYNYRKGKLIRTCFTGQHINNVIIDSEGCYWFLTAGKGLYRINSFEFTNYTFDRYKTGDVKPVFCLAQFGNQVYGGSSGSEYFTIDTESLTAMMHRLPVGALQTRITCMAEVPGYCIVFGTDDDFFSLGINGFKQTTAFISAKGIDVYGDSLLIASHISTRFINKDLRISRGEAFGRGTAALICYDQFYVGTLRGVYEMKKSREVVALGDKHPILKSRISALCRDIDGWMWIATYGQGVIKFKNGEITHVITTADGLSSNICRSIHAKGNDLWVGTDKGVNRIRFTRDTFSIIHFNNIDGLIADEVNALVAVGSRVYVGTPAGLTIFDPDKISGQSYCKLRLTGFIAGNKDQTYHVYQLVIPHSENAIRADFAGISYRSAGNITYKYRLVGLHDEWQTTRETYLSYPTLPSGDYELQVIAINKFGVQSNLLSIPFTIEMLIWERTWFRILAGVLVLLLIWWFVNNRIQNVKKQNEEKIQLTSRMTELEQMALKAQMNPHFIFNSLNSLQQYVIDKDVLGANKFITEFSRLIRLTLDISSKTLITVYDEISYLSTYLELEKTKFEDQFTYEIVLAPGLSASNLYLPPMILQPYVENSIRHGVRGRKDKGGHIKVAFSLQNSKLVCTIEDNGIGRVAAARFKSQMHIEYQSKGMTLTAKRIEMLNKEKEQPVSIDIEDLYELEIATGTRVTILFPLENAL